MVKFCRQFAQISSSCVHEFWRMCKQCAIILYRLAAPLWHETSHGDMIAGRWACPWLGSAPGPELFRRALLEERAILGPPSRCYYFCKLIDFLGSNHTRGKPDQSGQRGIRDKLVASSPSLTCVCSNTRNNTTAISTFSHYLYQPTSLRLPCSAARVWTCKYHVMQWACIRCLHGALRIFNQ